MLAALKSSIEDPTIVEGPLADDPLGIAGKVGLEGAPVVYQGEIVGTVKTKKKLDGKAWVRVQLARSTEYFSAIKDMVKQQGLALVLPTGAELRACGIATKTITAMLKPVGAAIKAAPISRKVGYKLVDAEDVSDFHRYLIRTRGSSCQEKLAIKQPTTFHFVRPAKSWEVPDVYGDEDRDTLAFTPDRAELDGSHSVYLRSDLTDEQVEEAISHELKHVQQLEQGRMGEPCSVLEEEAGEYGRSFVYDYNRRR